MEELSAMGIETYELDVTNSESVQRLKAVLGEALEGRLDILVNNA